ncbi:uncharacterized protein LOC127115212 [Lathyrus oleraceus]|uniref:uncharacterized protein LOC127115212 n=1 Tax=Pisum sativum TaxID=3888 RepID=UPI0021CE5431|nr:uncharacterized protein LOC127115212 [Pisum sativum]
MKVKCLFRLRYVPSDSGWNVIVMCGLHNHKLPKDLEGHDILGRIKDHERWFVNDMTKYNMAPSYIVTALKDKDPEKPHRNREDSNVIDDIFWMHPDSMKLVNMFHLVLIFDCTYKTNRYQIPLLEIVGVMLTKLTFFIGFVYLKHERDENFKWALKKLKEYVKSERQEHIMDIWNNIMYANRETEFIEHLKHFETICENIHLFVKFRNVLRVEHFGVQDIDKWMTIPDIGYLISCRYNIVFVSLSKRFNITFFPLTLAPPMYTSKHKIIDIGFVNNNHWVQIQCHLNLWIPSLEDLDEAI